MSLVRNLIFISYFAIDRVGRGGVITITWKRHVMSEILTFSSNHIDIQIMEKDVADWRITCFMIFQREAESKSPGIFSVL